MVHLQSFPNNIPAAIEMKHGFRCEVSPSEMSDMNVTPG